jgi:hypothetical protein
MVPTSDTVSESFSFATSATVTGRKWTSSAFERACILLLLLSRMTTMSASAINTPEISFILFMDDSFL